MKIASIGFTDRGGAGLSSLKLHKALKYAGIDSRFYVVQKKSIDKEVIQLEQRPGSERLSRFHPTAYPHVTYSTGLGGITNKQIREINQWADIVLLRWVSGVLSDHDIAWLTTQRHLYWTLSDMAPITGGCHYTVNDCIGYESRCENCPLTKSMKLDNSYPSTVMERRIKLWRGNRITFISPSKWLANMSHRSSVCQGSKIVVIPTGVEDNIFDFIPNSRTAFKLDPKEYVIFFAADSISDPRKGGDLLLAILDSIQSKSEKRVKMLVAGRSKLASHPLIEHLGELKDRYSMAMAYSAADLTLLPYRIDNLPNVMLESLACGTPVVAFRAGGVPEVIKDGLNGYLASPYNVNEIAIMALRALKEMRGKKLEIRNISKESLSIKTQVESYISLFSREGAYSFSN